MILAENRFDRYTFRIFIIYHKYIMTACGSGFQPRLKDLET